MKANTVNASPDLPIGKLILQLAVPSILAGLTIPLVGITDTAVAGRLGSAAHLGAIALGSMLFDWLYWNMGFLRVGTAGLTAQAYGKGDMREAVKIWVQGMGTAIGVSLLILLLQWPFAALFFRLVPSSPEVETMARHYFFIRIWAAPAALCLFSIRGWFIGMQNTMGSMITDMVVNLVNIFFSVFLGLYCHLGIAGVALGTVIAQYTGLITGLVLLSVYYGKWRHLIRLADALKPRDLRRLFVLNSNIFIRSICMLLIYTGITYIASCYGDTLLAVSTIMVKLFLLYSYFIDGFAYAGEALTGRFLGAHDVPNLKRSIAKLFVWCAVIGVAATLMYLFWSPALLRLLTNDKDVLNAAAPSIPWLYVMPLFSCIAFTWDGIYIGATAGSSLRNVMLWAVTAFYAVYAILCGRMGFQALWWGYFAHLLVRSVYLTAFAKRDLRRQLKLLS